jgi:hypothetical protein
MLAGMVTLLRPSLIFILLAVSLPAAPQPWARLTLGMTTEQTVALLGSPLLRTRGHGFETWTYDHGAEVLVHGTVVGWTAPASARLLVRSQDVWHGRRPGEHYATLQSGLPAASRKPAALTAPAIKRKPTARGGTLGYEEYIRG